MRIFLTEKARLTRPHRAPLNLPGLSGATERERGGELEKSRSLRLLLEWEIKNGMRIKDRDN